MNAVLIRSIQQALSQEKIDGWLFYSFRGSDPIAESILRLDPAQVSTRRWFYFIPASGEPQKIVHAIEPYVLDGLPGRKNVYLPWWQIRQYLSEVLSGVERIAMQYSPMNSIPYISRVDAGTIELVRSCGVEVVSSADLVQMFEAVWSEQQFESHLFAATHLREIVDMAFREVARRIHDNVRVTELDIQDLIWNEFARRDMIASHRPIVAINAHSADPHYTPDVDHNAPVHEGDFLLIDLWAKRRLADAVYADITWTGFVGKTVPEKHQKIFKVVREGRDAAVGTVEQRYAEGEVVHGSQVDEAARQSITAAGYGTHFLHRTGHSIHKEVHGNGANIDNIEAQDNRRLIPRTCFSIEPGVYLKGDFGVRSEINVYLAEDKVSVTGQPIQEYVVPILNC